MRVMAMMIRSCRIVLRGSPGAVTSVGEETDPGGKPGNRRSVNSATLGGGWCLLYADRRIGYERRRKAGPTTPSQHERATREDPVARSAFGETTTDGRRLRLTEDRVD